MKSWGQRTMIWKLPTIPFGVDACTFKLYLTQPFLKQLYTRQGMKLTFFLIATWLLIQKKLVTIFKDEKNLFLCFSVADKDLLRAAKWTLGWMIYNVQAHLTPRWCLVINRDACAAFWKQLNEKVCHRFIFVTLFNSLYLLVRLWWNILVANLATNFQDLVTKVKNLVTLAPVSGAISCAARLFMNCNIVTATWLYNLTSCLLCKLYTLLLTAGSSVFTHSVKSPVNSSGGK